MLSAIQYETVSLLKTKEKVAYKNDRPLPCDVGSVAWDAIEFPPLL